MKSFIKSFFWLPPLIGFLVYSRIIFFNSAWSDDSMVLVPQGKDFHLMLQTFYHNIPGLHFFPFEYFQSFLVNSIFSKQAFPFGFHLYGLFLHIIACLFATLVLFKITNDRLISVLIVSLWTVHPLNVETLARIACIPNQAAAGTFCLIFIYSFLKAMEVDKVLFKSIFYTIGVVFFLLSVLSYEQYLFFH